MTFYDLLSDAALRPATGFAAPADAPVLDVVTEAKNATADTLFVALRTPILDGHDAVLAAYGRGCRHFVSMRGLPLPPDACVMIAEDTAVLLGPLAEAVHGYPARYLTTVGITGSHGKTSTALLAAALLRESGRRVALLTTDGIDIGERFLPAGEIAPNAADIARFLRDAREANAEIAILELSAYMLEGGAAAGIPFSVALCTDFSPYRAFHGLPQGRAARRAAKARLLEGEAAVTVLPQGLADFSPRGRVFRYAVTQTGNAELALHSGRPYILGGVRATVSTLSYQGEAHAVLSPLIGEPAYHNLAAAMSLAIVLGEQPAVLAANALKARAVGRLDVLCFTGDRRVCFDAAYEAEDLSRALRLLRGITAGKLSVLLGAVGGRALQRRAPIGLAALHGADFVYFTADDPNSEPVSQITRDMVGENVNSTRYRTVASRADAIKDAVLDLRAGDTLLILGKPREETQLVMGQKHFFSDRRAVLDAIRDI